MTIGGEQRVHRGRGGLQVMCLGRGGFPAPVPERTLRRPQRLGKPDQAQFAGIYADLVSAGVRADPRLADRMLTERKLRNMMLDIG
jgi:hypothetical protein